MNDGKKDTSRPEPILLAICYQGVQSRLELAQQEANSASLTHDMQHPMFFVDLRRARIMDPPSESLGKNAYVELMIYADIVPGTKARPTVLIDCRANVQTMNERGIQFRLSARSLEQRGAETTAGAFHRSCLRIKAAKKAEKEAARTATQQEINELDRAVEDMLRRGEAVDADMETETAEDAQFAVKAAGLSAEAQTQGAVKEAIRRNEAGRNRFGRQGPHIRTTARRSGDESALPSVPKDHFAYALHIADVWRQHDRATAFVAMRSDLEHGAASRPVIATARRVFEAMAHTKNIRSVGVLLEAIHRDNKLMSELLRHSVDLGNQQFVDTLDGLLARLETALTRTTPYTPTPTAETAIPITAPAPIASETETDDEEDGDDRGNVSGKPDWIQ